MPTAIIIVSYKTPADVAECLRAIDVMQNDDGIGVFIVENGGSDAYHSLLQKVTTVCGEGSGLEMTRAPSALRQVHRCTFKLPRKAATVVVAEACENLGYGGGINSWLEQSEAMRPWTGFWILNPDTTPKPDALAALKAACARSGCGMAGSVIVDFKQRDRILTRGLHWRRWRGDIKSVDRGRTISVPLSEPDADIDAASGASIYVTRSCLDAIGFMSEEYFLYFEDVDWGMRAKAVGQLCRADDSLVPHKYGSSIGSSLSRGERSTLSVYLDTRNMLLFTMRHGPWFMPLAIARETLRAVEFFAVGSHKNGVSALSGIIAGLKGETGRPQWCP